MNARFIKLTVLVLVLSMASLAATPTGANAKQIAGIAEQHCTVRIESVPPGQFASEVYGFRCFTSFSDAIFDATAGRVQLDPTVSASELTQEMLLQDAGASGVTAQAATIIGIEYQDSGYSGNSFSWTTSNARGCLDGASFAATHMPNNWDNKVSSAIGYQGCDTFIHYQNVDFGGSSYTCTCSSMGYMNDRTSSVRILP